MSERLKQEVAAVLCLCGHAFGLYCVQRTMEAAAHSDAQIMWGAWSGFVFIASFVCTLATGVWMGLTLRAPST